MPTMGSFEWNIGVTDRPAERRQLTPAERAQRRARTKRQRAARKRTRR